MSDELQRSPPPATSAHHRFLDGRPQGCRIDSRDLMGGARGRVIVHAGRECRLRVTSHGKLLLTA